MYLFHSLGYFVFAQNRILVGEQKATGVYACGVGPKGPSIFPGPLGASEIPGHGSPGTLINSRSWVSRVFFLVYIYIYICVCLCVCVLVVLNLKTARATTTFLGPTRKRHPLAHLAACGEDGHGTKADTAERRDSPGDSPQTSCLRDSERCVFQFHSTKQAFFFECLGLKLFGKASLTGK